MGCKSVRLAEHNHILLKQTRDLMKQKLEILDMTLEESIIIALTYWSKFYVKEAPLE